MMQSIVISVFVCLFVCLFICPLSHLKNSMSKFRQIFCTCYLWSWLDPLLTEMRYVMYFRFLWMMSCFYIVEGINQNQRRRVCFKFSSPCGGTSPPWGNIIWLRSPSGIPEVSLLSPTAFCWWSFTFLYDLASACIYWARSILCIDLDECKAGRHNCTEPHMLCINVPGSYRCETTSTAWPLPTTTTSSMSSTTSASHQLTRDGRTPSDGDEARHVSPASTRDRSPAPPATARSTATTVATTTTPTATTTTSRMSSLSTMSGGRTEDNDDGPSSVSPATSRSTTTTTTTSMTPRATATTSRVTMTTSQPLLGDRKTSDDDDGHRSMSPATDQSTATTTRTAATSLTTTTTVSDADAASRDSVSVSSLSKKTTTTTTTDGPASSTSTPTAAELSSCRPGYVFNRVTSSCEGDRLSTVCPLLPPFLALQTSLRCGWQIRATRCLTPTVLYTYVDGQCDRPVTDDCHQFITLTVHLSWQHLRRSIPAAVPEIWLVPTKI